MAQKVVLIDDVDGSVAEETVAFRFEGVDYEIDLSVANLERMRESLAPFIAAARRPDVKSRARGRTSDVSAPSAAEIREWARANGWDMPERGRLSDDLRAAFQTAHEGR